MNLYNNIIDAFQESFRNNAELPAVTDYSSAETSTYLDLAARIAKIHILLKKAGISKNDHISLIGKNNSDWVTTYLGIMTYGAVVVPILPNFPPDDMLNVVEHSDSRFMFIDNQIWKSFRDRKPEGPVGVVDLETWKPLSDSQGTLTDILDNLDVDFKAEYPSFSVEDINYEHKKPDEVAIISYTSGTSGFAKGVMLTVRNLTFVAKFALDHKFHQKGSKVLSLLPLAHAYGCAFDMLTPLSIGSHITLLGKTPTPSILMKAMNEVRPDLLCTVPLVLEKIVKKQVFPKLEKEPIKSMLKIPLLRGVIYGKIRKSLMNAFGGRVKEVNVGGAALSSDVEAFLMKIKFPFTIGYGMTECAPLVSYAGWRDFVAGSAGVLLPGMQARIIPNEAGDSVGELCLKGDNVMKGYYKNPEANSAVFDEEGWFHTGDIAALGKDGLISLKGRCKSMILTSDGQNIYPETIEARLNELDGIAESLVVEEKGRLVALVVPDFEEVKRNGWEYVKSLMDSNLKKLNAKVASYERIANIHVCEEPFLKTPKQSIRRYLYPAAAKIKSFKQKSKNIQN